MTFSENKEINDVISQGLFRGNESALAVFMLETLKLSKTLKSSRDAKEGKSRKGDRGKNKALSKAILRRTGIFLPVGSGKSL